MASFEKFIKDLEKRQEAKKEVRDAQRRAYENHHLRRRVRLYSEKWSNSVRYTPKPPGGKK